MLHHLRIRNLALVDDLTCEFGPGLNVLTGETGAGKSIIVGALSLLIGQRADRSAIRAGASRCTVEAVLRLPENLPLDPVLRNAGVEPEPDGGLVLRRIIGADGGNRQFVNGVAVPVSVLGALGELLVDMHGPHDHQSLLRPAAQRDLLDAYAGSGDLREECRGAWRTIRQAESRIEEIAGDDRDVARRIDMLSFQIREIENAGLRPGEDFEVREQYRRASHGERIRELAAEAAGLLSESETAATERLAQAVRLLEELASLDPSAGDLSERAAGLSIETQELGAALIDYGNRLESDPETLRTLQERLDLIESLRRKYGGTIEEILAYRDRAQAELEGLRGRDEEIRKLQETIDRARESFEKSARRLSAARRRASGRVARAVNGNLAELGFPEGSLRVEIRDGEPGPAGRDEVSFLFSPNPGEPDRPLKNIASSGEISRVMLALKAAFADQDRVPVLIFDEIDVNVGGEIAHAVGETMRRIARRRQVICITHLPQVACLADHHFRVVKKTADRRTRTLVSPVEGEGRVREIARMLGGTRRASAALDHARELLQKAGAEGVD